MDKILLSIFLIGLSILLYLIIINIIFRTFFESKIFLITMGWLILWSAIVTIKLIKNIIENK